MTVEDTGLGDNPRSWADHVAFVSGGLLYGLLTGILAYAIGWMYVALGLTLMASPTPYAEKIGFTGAALLAVVVALFVTVCVTATIYEGDRQLESGCDA